MSLSYRCSNCHKPIPETKPICPHCFAVQRDRFTREELFNYLEEYFPTKPPRKPKITSTKVPIRKINCKEMILLGPFSFGISYFIYLLESLKALNDHWYLPHRKNELSTTTDMFVATLLLVTLNVFFIPFLQYTRYKKLRQHLLHMPNYQEDHPLPQKGRIIFWAYVLLDLFLLGSLAMFAFGGVSFVVDSITVLDSSLITAIFFLAAVLIFAGAIVIAVVLSRLEIRWYKIFSEHMQWHHKKLANDSRVRDHFHH